MVERTSTAGAPWTLVEANNKHFARIKVLKTLCAAVEAALARAPRKQSNEKYESSVATASVGSARPQPAACGSLRGPNGHDCPARFDLSCLLAQGRIHRPAF